MKNKLSTLIMLPLIAAILAFSGVSHAVTPVGVSLAPLPIWQINQGGIPCSGCKLFSYAAGTTTKQNTYTDYTGTTPSTNPIILDANGQAVIYLQTGLNYKLTLSPATDSDPPTNPYWTEDQIFNNNVSSAPYSNAGGTSDVITASYTVSSPLLTQGYPLALGIATPNATTNPTFAPTLNGLLQTARPIKKFVGNSEVALAVGDLQGIVNLVYDANNLVWTVLNPAVANASVKSANVSSNLAGGSTGTIPYQSATNTTAQLVAGTSGQVLTSNGANAPSWTTVSATPTITAIASSGILTVTLVSPASIVGQFQGVPFTANINSNLTINTQNIASSLGATSGQQTRLAVVYLPNSAAIGLVNMAGGLLLDETPAYATVVISASSTSATTVYSASGAITQPFKIIGFIDTTWTSGVGWSNPAAVISASAAAYTGSGMASIGYGQTWQTPARSFNTTYYNTTGKPILVSVETNGNGSGVYTNLNVNSVQVSQFNNGSTSTIYSTLQAIVPIGQSYSVTGTSGSILAWVEMR